MLTRFSILYSKHKKIATPLVGYNNLCLSQPHDKQIVVVVVVVIPFNVLCKSKTIVGRLVF